VNHSSFRLPVLEVSLAERVYVNTANGVILSTNYQPRSGKYRMNSSVSPSRCLIAIFFNPDIIYKIIYKCIRTRIFYVPTSSVVSINYFYRQLGMVVIRLQSKFTAIFSPSVARYRAHHDEGDPVDVLRPRCHHNYRRPIYNLCSCLLSF
jgi:hypothetical protein